MRAEFNDGFQTAELIRLLVANLPPAPRPPEALPGSPGERRFSGLISDDNLADHSILAEPIPTAGQGPCISSGPCVVAEDADAPCRPPWGRYNLFQQHWLRSQDTRVDMVASVVHLTSDLSLSDQMQRPMRRPQPVPPRQLLGPRARPATPGKPFPSPPPNVERPLSKLSGAVSSSTPRTAFAADSASRPSSRLSSAASGPSRTAPLRMAVADHQSEQSGPSSRPSSAATNGTSTPSRPSTPLMMASYATRQRPLSSALPKDVRRRQMGSGTKARPSSANKPSSKLKVADLDVRGLTVRQHELVDSSPKFMAVSQTQSPQAGVGPKPNRADVTTPRRALFPASTGESIDQSTAHGESPRQNLPRPTVIDLEQVDEVDGALSDYSACLEPMGEGNDL